MNTSKYASVGRFEKTAYGLGDLSSNLIWTMLITYIIYFYTDVYGMSAAAAGTMMLSVRIWDAFINPIIGLVSDRTKTRWGNFRPYLLWGAIPLGVTSVLLFTTPSWVGPYKVIYAYVSYIALITIYSVVNIPYSALMGVMSSNSVERESLSRYRFALAFAGAIVVQFCTFYLVQYFGSGDDKLGFQYTMTLYAVIAVLLMFVTFWFTRERVQAVEEKQGTVKQDVTDLFSNKPWLILCFVSFVTKVYYAIRTGSILYYFKYYVENEAAAPVFMAGGSLFLIIGILSTKYLTKNINKVKLFSALLFIDGILISALYFVDADNLLMINALHFVGLLFIGPYTVMIWSMYSDSADYSEWKTGRRATGLVFSASVFTQKLGVAVGGAVVAWVLAMSGFVPNTAQPELVITNIKVLMSLLPGALSFISATAILFYSLKPEQMIEIEKDLNERRDAGVLV